MKFFTLLSISCLLFLFSACDCAYDYTYEVENQSSSTIKVSWEQDIFQDSVEITPGNTESLFTTIHGIEPCQTGPFFEDVNITVVSIQITRDDSVTTKLNYRENEQWSYENGLYKAVVADSSF